MSSRFLMPPALVLAVLVLLAAALVSSRAVRVQNETSQWVAHTYQVIATLERTVGSLTRAETAQRGYLLTGDEAELAPFNAARLDMQANLDRLTELTIDNPNQQQRLPALRAAVVERLSLLADVIALRRAGDMPAAIALVGNHGRSAMDRVLVLTDDVRTEENRLLQDRLHRARRASQIGVLATVGTSAVALVLLLSLHIVSSRHAERLNAERDELRISREQTHETTANLHLANEQLQQATAELEQRVRERTAALVEANTELEGFARSIAHDLRAPLRNMHGFAAALIEDEGPRMSKKGLEYAHRLAASAARMEGLISDLLNYSRLARGELTLDRVDVNTVVRQVLQELAADIERTGAIIEVANPLPPVLAHRATLTQVLMNLLSNALKFVQPGAQPRITLAARVHDHHVSLSVTDNGIGIAPANQKRIFAVFERLHGPERYPGTGIGLSIVRKGVERMGGAVHLESTPGLGSRFIVELPAAEMEAA
ncbi:MAG TPA: CHASE3 domain-containing protein [Burkholderiaceae bacterium]|nr:CHASE3 domain-containing protein [Burkholderiaceae bacterium]